MKKEFSLVDLISEDLEDSHRRSKGQKILCEECGQYSYASRWKNDQCPKCLKYSEYE